MTHILQPLGFLFVANCCYRLIERSGQRLGFYELDAISKPHLTPNGGVAALFKMLTYD